jgi:hypothetical protein
VPFTLKLYDTIPLPTFVGVAVNIIEPPLQMGEGWFDVIETVGVSIGFTTNVKVLDVAIVAEIQEPPEIEISQLTVLPFSNVLEEKVFEFVF